MNKFMTLIKRDLTENKNALIFTPLVIAAIILVLYLFATLSGQISISASSTNFHAFFENGNLSNLSPDQIKGLSAASVAFSAASAVFIIVVSIFTSFFTLSTSLYDERKDKSIMFWKSLPISDLETVLAKLVSIVFTSIGFATIVAFALHIILIAISVFISNKAGINNIDFGVIFQIFGSIWVVLLLSLFCYILGALPIYAWFLLMSAKVDKGPFWAAILPIILLPIIVKVIFGANETIANIPLDLVLGKPVLETIMAIMNQMHNGIQDIDIAQIINGFMMLILSPITIIGVVISAPLLWGAAQIRKSKSF